MWLKNGMEQKIVSLSRDLNTGPADYKSAALPTKPLRRHILWSLKGKKYGAAINYRDAITEKPISIPNTFYAQQPTNQ